MQLPPPGDYVAKTNGQIIIGEATTGAYLADVPYVISQGDNAGFAGRALVTLVKKDGEIVVSAIENMKAAFGWDGMDLGALANEFPDKEFALSQCVHEDYDGKTYFKVGFVNPLGGGLKRLTPADPKVLATKFGAKLRALAGGKSVAPSTKTTDKPKPTPPTPPAKPDASVTPCTMTEAYAVCMANADGNEQAAGVAWYAAMDAMFPGKNNSELTNADFGRLRSHFEK